MVEEYTPGQAYYCCRDRSCSTEVEVVDVALALGNTKAERTGHCGGSCLCSRSVPGLDLEALVNGREVVDVAGTVLDAGAAGAEEEAAAAGASCRC